MDVQLENIYTNEPYNNAKRSGDHMMEHQQEEIYEIVSPNIAKKGCRCKIKYVILVFILISIVGSYAAAISLSLQKNAPIYEDIKNKTIKLQQNIEEVEAKLTMQKNDSFYEDIKNKTIKLQQNIEEVEAKLRMQNESFFSKNEEIKLELNEIKAQFEGCPGVTYHFPRDNQVEDYVRYTSGVPTMAEFTMCTWFEGDNYFGSSTDTIFSYAVPSNNNEIWIYFSSYYDRLYFPGSSASLYWRQRFYGNKKAHICVWYSSNRGSGLFLNGTENYTRTFTRYSNITGGGSLILGQDQDNVGGLFQSSQAFRGNLTNIIVWDRVLSNSEIFNIAKYCVCPKDYTIAMLPFNTQIYGEASYSIASECPVI